MMNKRRIMTIGGTLVCALGIGYFMQLGGAAPVPATAQPTEPPLPQSADGVTEVAKAGFSPLDTPVNAVAPAMTETPAATPAAPVAPERAPEQVPAPAFDASVLPPVDRPADTPEPVMVAGLDQSDIVIPEAPGAQSEPELTCDIVANAVAEAGAMVRVTVDAACLPDERVVIHHNGMMFTDVTDASGQLEVVVPALAENAVFIAEFGTGDGAVATAEVTSLTFYDRIVLQWADDVSFQIHAREFGADYGSDGHVWSGSARDMTAAALGEGGFLTTLGKADLLAPRLAEVYTFPTATASRSGTVSMTIETEITAENCGRLIEAQALEIKAEGELVTRDLSLNMPNCDAIGDFLVLNNLVDDLKIASR